MTDEAITAVAGLVASFLSGLLGIGGGLVLTPLLLYLPPLVGGVAIPVQIVTGLTIVQAIAGSALVLGFFGGIVGIGGIAFIIAALVYILRVPPRIAIGSSLGIGLFAAVAALIGKAATAQIDPPLAAIVFISAVVASPIGAAVSVRTQPRALLAILSVVVILAAIGIALTAVP